MELFDFLKSMTVKKEALNLNDSELSKKYSPYIINRFISMSQILLPYVNAINKCTTIPKQAHYDFFNSILPKRKQYFKYIKKKKDVNEKEKECIMKYYEIGKNEVEEYIRLLTEKQIKQIVTKFDGGKTR